MRWFWIDRFSEFVCGESATAVKNVSLAEEYLHDHFDGYPIMRMAEAPLKIDTVLIESGEAAGAAGSGSSVRAPVPGPVAIRWCATPPVKPAGKPVEVHP